MEIITLEDGAAPPAEVDCIRIYSKEGGAFEMMGTALCEGDSIVFVPDAPLASRAAAIDMGIAWANEVDVATLYVAIDPSPTEADEPL